MWEKNNNDPLDNKSGSIKKLTFKIEFYKAQKLQETLKKHKLSSTYSILQYIKIRFE